MDLMCILIVNILFLGHRISLELSFISSLILTFDIRAVLPFCVNDVTQFTNVTLSKCGELFTPSALC